MPFFREALQVLEVEGRARVGKHAGILCDDLRILEVRAFHIIGTPHLRDVHHAGADGHGYGLRFRFQLREHVARVVVEPLRLRVVALGRESDRTADLHDHLGDSLLEAPEQVVVVLDVRGKVPGVGVTHMYVQNRGAGVVAVHRCLDLFVPGHGDVFRIASQVGPYGAALMITGVCSRDTVSRRCNA